MKVVSRNRWVALITSVLLGGCGEPLSAPVAQLADNLNDSFDGSGPLQGYVTNNPQALPAVSRQDGRYRAELTNNKDDVTLHYHDAQGRLDARAVQFPFEVVARNIGIGTLADSQVPPSPAGEPFLFAGIQIHVTNLDSRNSSHVVVGHRGETPFTVEAKNTVNGHSQVNDAGANIVPDGRADLKITGNKDRTLTVYWQRPVLDGSADNWQLYNGDGKIPGKNPKFGDTVYVGLITYAFRLGGLPFVGTCDALEGGTLVASP